MESDGAVESHFQVSFLGQLLTFSQVTTIDLSCPIKSRRGSTTNGMRAYLQHKLVIILRNPKKIRKDHCSARQTHRLPPNESQWRPKAKNRLWGIPLHVRLHVAMTQASGHFRCVVSGQESLSCGNGKFSVPELKICYC